MKTLILITIILSSLIGIGLIALKISNERIHVCINEQIDEEVRAAYRGEHYKFNVNLCSGF